VQHRFGEFGARRHSGQRVLFLYTPGRAGKLFEEMQQTGRTFATMNPDELMACFARHGWEVLGPSPF